MLLLRLTWFISVALAAWIGYNCGNAHQDDTKNYALAAPGRQKVVVYRALVQVFGEYASR